MGWARAWRFVYSGHSRISFSPLSVERCRHRRFAPSAACSSPNYVTPCGKRVCEKARACARLLRGAHRRGTAPSSRRTNKRMDRARCGAARSKSTDLVGALRRCITVGVTRASADRPFRPLSPANVGVTEYLLSVRASTLEGGRRVHRARICTLVRRTILRLRVAVITGTTARYVWNVMQNCIAQFAPRAVRLTNRPVRSDCLFRVRADSSATL